MLAGRVRLKTFLAGAAALLVVGSCGALALPLAGVALFAPTSSVTTPAVPVVTAPTATAPVPLAAPSAIAASQGTGATAAAASPGGRPADEAVLRYLGKPLGSDKKKDVTSGAPYKVNVYQDAGEAVANRAKLDLDRDEKWDEKFTWKGGTVERQVAPNDDESYTETYTWTGSGWAKK